ncbi:hypothetical protein MJO29_002872, partial [Puccinia striiformis f. sp. tritici]
MGALGNLPAIDSTEPPSAAASRGVSRPSSVTSHLWLAENPLPPLDPMSEDDNEPNHGPRTSEADAYSACGSLDGFIQPPPPHVAAAYHAIGPEDFQRMYPTNCTAERMPSEEPMPASPMPAATPCQATQVADNPLIESMLALAQLSQADLQLGRQLFNAPEEIQWKLSVIMWLSRRPTPSTVHNAVPTNGLAPFVYSQVIRLKTFPSHLMCVLLQLGPSSTEDTRNSLQKLIRVVQSPPIVTRGTAHPFAASADQNAFVLELPQAFRRQHLPPGLPTNHDS